MNLANTNSILKRTTLAPRNWIAFIAAVMVRLKALAPYALIELILPGGSVMALALWLYRRRKNGVGFGPLPMKLLALLRLANPLPFSAGSPIPATSGCSAANVPRASATICGNTNLHPVPGLG